MHDRADVARGLAFGADDANSSPDRQTVTASEAADTSSTAAAAAATPPRFLRSVSFSAHPQVLEPKEGRQEERASERQSDERQLPIDGSNLPDGIQAIPVADPDDPNAIVMQVSGCSLECKPDVCHLSANQGICQYCSALHLLA